MAGQLKSGTIIAHLVVDDATKALDFYKNGFGAEIKGVHKTPDGKVMHAELSVGGARLMLADEFPGAGSPKKLGGSPVVLNLYVPGLTPGPEAFLEPPLRVRDALFFRGI